VLAALLAAATAGAQTPDTTAVRVCTDRGSFTIELDNARAPIAAANFRHYVEQGFYAGTVFHRIVPDRVVQGGGFDRKLVRRPTDGPVANESNNGLSNRRGTVAAARLDDPDSATSQFFVNLADNRQLDGSDDASGFTVFGRVVAGLDIVDAVGALPTRALAPLPGDVPDPLVTVWSMSIVAGTDAAAETSSTETAGPGTRATAAAGADRTEAAAATPEDVAGTPAHAAAADPAAEAWAAFDAARDADDPAAVLAAVDRLHMRCAEPTPALLLAEADAALSLGQDARARFALDNYFATAESTAIDFDDAQRLYRRLPQAQQSGIGPLIAHCQMPEAPEIADGSTADLDTMVAVQTAMRRFMDMADLYLDCLTDVIDQKGLNDAYEVAAVERHNEVVGLMEDLAEQFNKQVRAYKARQ
jgi:cyclophilin family peptidyl-prolyl cis-trans isomerase